MHFLESFSPRVRQKEVLREQAVSLFYKVRDVPYVLGLDGDPRELFVEGKGNCTRKSLYLKWQLGKLGYKVNLGSACFNWRDLPIPKGILDLLVDPIQDHMFLFVDDGDSEMIVDATWDAALATRGFALNTWDGRNSTALGVQPLRVERLHYEPFMARAVVGSFVHNIEGRVFGNKPTPFNDAFNHWAVEVRLTSDIVSSL